MRSSFRIIGGIGVMAASLFLAAACSSSSSAAPGPTPRGNEDGGPANSDDRDGGPNDDAPSDSGIDATVPPKDLAGPTIATGATHACALLDDHSVKCWGGNDSGQLGRGDTLALGFAAGQMGDALPPVNVGAGQKAIGVAAGGGHSCAVLADHSVKCWGANDSGQLGIGDTKDHGDGANEMGDKLPVVNLGTGRTALGIAAGVSHTCALLDDHSVKCWGANGSGQLGIESLPNRGSAAADMGDALPAVKLGTGRTALRISAGGAHTCALLDDHSVKCWGSNDYGQLGSGDTVTRGRFDGEMGDARPPVDLGTGRTALRVVAGLRHTCAVLDDHSVKCWGGNDWGQLGLEDSKTRGDKPGSMGAALSTVNLGSGRTALEITAGLGHHTCAVLDDHSVKCWGRQQSGQLGTGEAKARGFLAGSMGDALPTVQLGAGRSAKNVVAGDEHSCALLDDNAVKCWGANSFGQLGCGDGTFRGDAPSEMGDNLPAVDLGTGRTALAP